MTWCPGRMISMKQENYYLSGEEKFGGFTSKAYSLFSGMSYWKYYRAVVNSISMLHPGSVLDVGCGPGDILVNLAQHDGNTELFGTDPSPQMIRAAEKKIRKKGLEGRITLKQGSSRNIPFQRKFDLVVSSFSFHHWMQKDESLNHLSGFVSDSGRIVMFELDRDQFPGKLPFVSAHTLSANMEKEFQVEGFQTDLKSIPHSGIMMLVFTRR